MEGTIFDIKRFAVHDGPGIRTTVFFKGCPLNCHWCHNPESISKHPEMHHKTVHLNGLTHILKQEIGYTISSDTLLMELEKERIFMEESDGGVTFSGGEPLYQADFLLACLTNAKNAGFHTAIDTSLLSDWETVAKTVPLTDLYLVDLKLINNKLHQQYTHVSNRKILENLLALSQETTGIRIRIPLIPEVNTTHENISKTIQFISQIKSSVLGVDLLPFHNTASAKYDRFKQPNRFAQTPSLNKEAVIWIKEAFEAAGLTTTLGG